MAHPSDMPWLRTSHKASQEQQGGAWPMPPGPPHQKEGTGYAAMPSPCYYHF